MKTEKPLEEFDRMIEEFDKGPSSKPVKNKDYGCYLVVGIAVLIIALGVVAAAFLDSPSHTGGFVIIDLTTHHPNAVEVECKDNVLCTEWKEWSRHTEEKEPVAAQTQAETLPITGSAVVSGAHNLDILWAATYIIASLCLLTVFAYLLDFYLKGIAPTTSWLVFAYWLVMIGVPLSIYYAVTRNEHMLTAYVAFGITLASLIVLVIEKPWSRLEITELKNVNRMIAESSYDVKSRTRRIKQEKKEKVLPKFLEKIRQGGWERKFKMIGIKEEELKKINKGIKPLAKGADAGAAMVLEVEESIAERERRLEQLNQSLESWVEKRRRMQEK